MQILIGIFCAFLALVTPAEAQSMPVLTSPDLIITRLHSLALTFVEAEFKEEGSNGECLFRNNLATVLSLNCRKFNKDEDSENNSAAGYFIFSHQQLGLLYLYADKPDAPSTGYFKYAIFKNSKSFHPQMNLETFKKQVSLFIHPGILKRPLDYFGLSIVHTPAYDASLDPFPMEVPEEFTKSNTSHYGYSQIKKQVAEIAKNETYLKSFAELIKSDQPVILKEFFEKMSALEAQVRISFANKMNQKKPKQNPHPNPGVALRIFSASWCGACQNLHRNFRDSQELDYFRYRGHQIPVQWVDIDDDKNKLLLPERIVGYLPEIQLINANTRGRNKIKFNDQFRRNPEGLRIWVDTLVTKGLDWFAQ